MFVLNILKILHEKIFSPDILAEIDKKLVTRINYNDE